MTANLAAKILRTIDILANGEVEALVPIHAIRSAVVASRDEFDRTMMEMMSNGLEVIAISDSSRATSEQLEQSIEGVNETLFYVIA